MMATLTAATLHEQLTIEARGNSQRLGTLHRLKQACDALVAGGKNFSLKDIETYCKNTFDKGPNAQSISNDKGLRAYVDALRNEAALIRRGKPHSPLDQDIEAIVDLDLRSRMRVLAEEYRLARKRFRILTDALSKLSLPLDLDAILKGEHSSVVGNTPRLAMRAHIDEFKAFRRVLSVMRDDERLRRAGLDIDGGDIISRGLRETLIEGQDITLLENLLCALEGSNDST